MLTKYFVKQRMVQIVLCIGSAMLFLAACASNNIANTNVAPTRATINAATAIVKHTPTGTAELAWDPTTHLLTVHMALTGLAANSIHPTSIYTGSCNNAGKELYPLSSVKADSIGFANGVTKIKDVTTGIPTSGWYVSVHNGPALTSAEQSLSISCADIVNPAASTKTPQDVQATLLGTAAPGQSASGTAQLTVNNNQLTVVVSLQGLVPNSQHAAHIHYGSCASQGKVIYTLKPVIANGAGDAHTTTIIPNVTTIPASGWYINVHRMTNLSTQTDEDPVACGDITPVH